MPVTGQEHLVRMVMEASAFVLVMSLWLVAVLLWVSKQRKRADLVKVRLGALGQGSGASTERVLRLWHDGKEATTIVAGKRAAGLRVRMQKVLVDAGMESTLSSALTGLLMMLGVVAAAAFVLTSSVFAAIAAPVAVLVVVWLVITHRIAKRMEYFEAQLIDAMELAARSLRVGHPLIASFQLIAEEVPAPIGELFGEVCQQQQLGVAMDEALRSVSSEVSSPDLQLFATSVVIQLRSGGNLADMMMRLSGIIRERNRLTRRVRVLTAQTQFSKRVLLALPFLIFVAMLLINPTYMRVLYATPLGQLILMAASVVMFIGWMLMNWLSRLTP